MVRGSEVQSTEMEAGARVEGEEGEQGPRRRLMVTEPPYTTGSPKVATPLLIEVGSRRTGEVSRRGSRHASRLREEGLQSPQMQKDKRGGLPGYTIAREDP